MRHIQICRAGLSLLLQCIVVIQYVNAQRKIDTTKFTMRIFGKDTIVVAKEKPADRALKNNNLYEAISLYRRQLEEEPCSPTDNNNLAIAYVRIGKLDSALFYLKISLDIDPRCTFIENPEFLPLINTKEWRRLESNYVAMVKKYGLGIKDVVLAHELWKMEQLDQEYYKELSLAENKWGPKCKQVDSIWAIKNVVNEKNLKHLKAIVAKKGWPRSSVVGKKAAVAAFLIIQHADLETQKQYEPIIESAADKGDASWRDVAILIDRLRVKENKPQLYGSQLRWNEEAKTYEPCPIEDEHNLDIRRKKVGLNSAADYYQNWNIQYTVLQNKE
jgi:hypothetical protein